LEIAELARGLDVVAQAGPAGGDGAGQDVAHRGGEALGPAAGDRGGDAARREPRPVEALRDVDVAEPGDDALIEERRLDRRHPAGERCGEARPVERVAKWL